MLSRWLFPLLDNPQSRLRGVPVCLWHGRSVPLLLPWVLGPLKIYPLTRSLNPPAHKLDGNTSGVVAPAYWPDPQRPSPRFLPFTCLC